MLCKQKMRRMIQKNMVASLSYMQHDHISVVFQMSDVILTQESLGEIEASHKGRTKSISKIYTTYVQYS